MSSLEHTGSSPALQARSLPEQIHQILRLRILNNELPAGAPLVELPLAAEFGVSRTTIRSAMRELRAERLIEVSPRRGSTVARMSERDIEEVCYARYVLESADLVEVLTTGRASLVSAMSAALDAMRQAAAVEDVAGVILADTELHRVIVERGRHATIIQMWTSLNGQMGALMRSDLDRQGIGIDETVRRHANLVSVMRRRDPEAAVAALRQHYLDPMHDA